MCAGCSSVIQPVAKSFLRWFHQRSVALVSSIPRYAPHLRRPTRPSSPARRQTSTLRGDTGGTHVHHGLQVRARGLWGGQLFSHNLDTVSELNHHLGICSSSQCLGRRNVLLMPCQAGDYQRCHRYDEQHDQHHYRYRSDFSFLSGLTIETELRGRSTFNELDF